MAKANYGQILINGVTKKIDSADKQNIFLVGEPGTGKSEVLENYLKKNDKAVDVSARFHECSLISDPEVFELYHVCLIVHKINKFINKMDIGDRKSKTIMYDLQIKIIINSIIDMCYVRDFSNKYVYIDKKLLKNPMILFDRLVDSLVVMNLDDLTLVLDDFDAVCYSNPEYQKYVYETLANKLRLIATISDETFINSPERREELSKENSLVDIDYAHDKVSIIKLFDTCFLKDLEVDSTYLLQYRLSNIVDDWVIEEMIRKTKGSIFDMRCLIQNFYDHILELDPKSYADYLLNATDKYIERFNRYKVPRTFHIK